VISLTDTRTGASWGINPYPAGIGSSGQWMEFQKYRFNWNAPIVLSPQDPKTVYYGGNVLFRTRNYGQSWDVISPDVTTNDKSKQKSSGGPIVTDNTAAEFHCTIIAIGPSRVDPNVIWVGTDDGNVQVTRDGGKTWTNTFKNAPGLAPFAWISTVDASPFDAGTAYVSASHWQDNDYAPYFYRTADFGKTWTKITNGLPARGWSHVIREDLRTKGLLYAGTENGLYASWDDGARWVSIRNNMPPVPVRDLVIHPRDNDIIVATHGRGFYILDDASALQGLGKAMKTEAYLFPTRPAVRWGASSGMFRSNQRDWMAPNPPAGAYFDVYLRNSTPEPVTITITDKAGKTVRVLREPRAAAGVNRVVWNLRYDNPSAPRPVAPVPGMADVPPAIAERFGGGNQGPMALPGEYGVKVKAGAQELTGTARVVLDPAVQASPTDMQAQLDASFTMMAMRGRVNAVIERVDGLMTQLTAFEAMIAGQSPVPAYRADVRAALDKLNAFRDTDLARPLPGLGYRQYPRLREDVQSIADGVARGFRPLTEGEKLRMKELAELTDKAAARLNGIITGDIAKINDATKTMPRIVGDLVK
jgi:hypothetical protein